MKPLKISGINGMKNSDKSRQIHRLILQSVFRENPGVNIDDPLFKLYEFLCERATLGQLSNEWIFSSARHLSYVAKLYG